MSVTVLIPVGPNYNPGWLKESVESVLNQTHEVTEIFFVDDGSGLSIPDCYSLVKEPGYAQDCYYKPFYNDRFFECSGYTTDEIHQRGGKGFWNRTDKNGGRDNYFSFWRSPCNLGFTAAFNVGMALSNNDLVVYLAADDKLMPQAVEKAVHTWEKNNQKDAWYSFTYIDSTGKKSEIPINAAMITKGLWRKVGGYPPAAFVGPDAAVLSCLIAHAPDRIIHVDPGNPLYWIRDHADQETKTHTWRFVDEMTSIRNKLTRDFKMRD